LTKNIVVKPSIRPDIRYPAFGLTGYPAKTVSGASLGFCFSLQEKTITAESSSSTGSSSSGGLFCPFTPEGSSKEEPQDR
jgi:hypothetical protein